MGQLIDGKATAAGIRARLKQDIQASAVTPGLAIVLMGDDPASRIYVARKRAACAEVGIRVEVIERPATITERELLADVASLNERPNIHGIIVQRPLPSHIAMIAVTVAIAPDRDVDGLHPENVGLLLLGQPRFIPATPKGIRELLLRSGYDPAHRHVVIIGRGPLVGKPLAALLMQRGRGGNATVSVCHTGTRDLSAITRTADILVVAIGKPRFVTANMVRPGVAIVDAGINRVPDATSANGIRIVGDVDPAAYERAEAYTPVPGGVGPMTVAMLLENVVEAARKKHRVSS